MPITHQFIRDAVIKRIQSGEWPLGSQIPAESDLATEYGCSRSTINRALQQLADEGLVVRKRKGGTRVCQAPVRQARFQIPMLREQIEHTGSTYQHRLLTREIKAAPDEICGRLGLRAADQPLYLETVHLADETPFALERRWVNTGTVPDVLNAPLDTISANEWLINTVPFSTGEVVFGAANASPSVAAALDISAGAAVFVVSRTTWLNHQSVTTLKLYYQPGYQLFSEL